MTCKREELTGRARGERTAGQLPEFPTWKAGGRKTDGRSSFPPACIIIIAIISDEEEGEGGGGLVAMPKKTIPPPSLSTRSEKKYGSGMIWVMALAGNGVIPGYNCNTHMRHT